MTKAYIVYDLEQNIVGVVTDRFYRNKEELEEDLYKEYKTRKFDIDIFDVEESKLFFTARNLLDEVK